MQAIKVGQGVHWVGAIDWDLKNFHGYQTQRGTSYNSYLIQDEKTVLIDAVKEPLFDQLLQRISTLIDPSKIDYIVSNHVEMDHTGSLPKLLKLAPNAKIITSTKGEKGLAQHFKHDWNLMVVKSGDTLNIGKRTLTFVHTPMVHWPDNMVTYMAENSGTDIASILFSNDAFGQHIASTQRFDDELGWDVVKEEAGKYYANIVFPFGGQVTRALEALKPLKIDLICPSHGLIWRSHIDSILKEYIKWSSGQVEERAVIVYDSMWGSTTKMAKALGKGLENNGVPVIFANLGTTHISDVMSLLLTAKYILVGSPTLNNGMLPTVAGFLTYMKGLKPKNRVGLAFGSYGWGGQSIGEIENILKDMGWNMPLPGMKMNYIPDHEELENMTDKVKELVNASAKGE